MKDFRRLANFFRRFVRPAGASSSAAQQAEGGHGHPGFPHEPEVSSKRAGLRFPLSDLQRAYLVGRAWRRLGGVGCHVYNEFENSQIDLPRLQTAWRRLIDRHDMLRAQVTEDGEGLVLSEVPPFEIAVTDLARANAARRESELAAIREAMSHRLYDPHQWPLFDLRVTRLPAKRFRLHFSFDLLMLDAASITRLLAELRGLYKNPEQAKICPRPQQSSGKDAMARPALMESKRFAQAQAYWEKRLPELAVRPALPVAMDPGAITSARFTRHSGMLAAPQWAQLRRNARELGITPTALLAAAFSEVLGKWCNQRRFTLNIARFRPLPAHQIASPVGDFTTTTLLEINLDGADFPTRARELMARLRRDGRHGLYSGVRVLRAMRQRQLLADDYGMPVVFTSLLAPQARARQRALSTAWLGDCVYGISQTPQVWLDHQVAEQDSALIFHWDAIERLFPAGLIEDMFSAYTDYLDRLGAGDMSGLAISRPTLPAVQRERRSRYNATEAPPVSGLLHAGFFAMSKTQPTQIAVDDPERRVSYGELAEHASSVARRLRKAGVRAGDIVAVVMEKGWEQIACVLGILRAGAAYLPIEPTLPKTRIEYLLSNGRASIVLTQARLRNSLAWPSRVEVWTLGENEADAADPYDGPEPGPDSLAYMIYTSGSSGEPKGVMISHRAALNTIVDINRRLEITAADRVLALSSLSFDLSVYDIFGILECGATVVLPAPESSRDPMHWIHRMNECGVTIWNSAPALMQMMMMILEASLGNLTTPLRAALLSGDWIPVELPGRIKRFAPNCQLLSLGGATEVAIWSIAYPIEKVDPAWTSIPYGIPLANQRVHVLDDNFEPCPEWTSGELYIGGDGLALGYWADEEKTAQQFVRLPSTGELLYRTGDYGRFRPEGFVEFLGRRDTQIKIRGHRVEIGEIEASLLRHPGVREAAALNISKTSEDRSSGRLVGCVVLHETASASAAEPAPDEAELRAHLAKLLPSHMIPSRIVALDKLPLNCNGKVDRNVLAKSKIFGTRKQQTKPRAPRTEMEERIHRVWTGMLGCSEVDLDANIFDAGVDSFRAIQFQSTLRGELAIELELADLFRHPTVRSLAALVAKRTEARAIPGN